MKVQTRRLQLLLLISVFVFVFAECPRSHSLTGSINQSALTVHRNLSFSSISTFCELAVGQLLQCHVTCGKRGRTLR